MKATSCCTIRRLLVIGAVVLAALGTATTAGASFDTPQLVNSWGAAGSDPGQFAYPRGVAVDRSNRVYVVDQGNDRVQVFTATGTFVRQWGGSGTGDGQFDSPTGIAVDGTTGDVWVADHGTSRIQRFSATGDHELTFGGHGSNPGQFSGLTGLAVDAAGNLWVAEAGNDRLQRFDSEGTHQLTIGGFGTGDGQFRDPFGLAVSPVSGDLYVADGTNSRIQRFSAGGSYLGQWGTPGTAFATFDDPWGVTVDADGNVYVTETANNRVQAFSATGGFLSAWGSLGTGDGQFQYPVGIAVDRLGRVQVADESPRVQTFATAAADGRIRRGTTGVLLGNDIVNTNGVGQWARGSAPRGGTVLFTLSVQNDAPFAERLRLDAGGSSPAFVITYRTVGGTNVTGRVLNGTYLTPRLGPRATHTLRITVLVRTTARVGASVTHGISTISTTQPGIGDTVKFTARRS